MKIKTKNILFTFVAIIILVTSFLYNIKNVQASGSTCDVYVDSVSGNDANNGTSSTTPLQHFSALPALSNGNTVCLRRGSIFKESLVLGLQGGTRLDNVTVQDYGPSNLEKPLIDGSNVIASSSWTAVGGSFPNLYQAEFLQVTVLKLLVILLF